MEAGVTEIALTEHLFRFTQAKDLLGGFWDDLPGEALRPGMAAYWDHHAHVDLDHYVEVVQAVKAEGLPVVLGLEVDYYQDRMDDVAGLLAGYPFDVLLGSVHWLGAWRFDVLNDPLVMAEWDVRAIDAVWDEYARAMEELGESGVCDVFAHPDLVKVAGRVPTVTDEYYDRITEAAVRSGMAAELSSAGWRKPVGEEYPAPALLQRLVHSGVPADHGLGRPLAPRCGRPRRRPRRSCCRRPAWPVSRGITSARPTPWTSPGRRGAERGHPGGAGLRAHQSGRGAARAPAAPARDLGDPGRPVLFRPGAAGAHGPVVRRSRHLRRPTIRAELVILGQMRPSNSATVVEHDLVGQTVASADWPLAVHTVESGEVTRGEVLLEAGEEPVRLHCIPVRCDGSTVAVLARLAAGPGDDPATSSAPTATCSSASR